MNSASQVLYGAENFINKAKVKEEAQDIQLDYKDGKYVVNGQPFAPSVRPEPTKRRHSTKPVKESTRKNSSAKIIIDDNSKGSIVNSASSLKQSFGRVVSSSSRNSSRRSSSGSRRSSSSESEGKSSTSVRPVSEETAEQRHDKVVYALVQLEERGVAIDKHLHRFENMREAEDFLKLHRARVKIKGKLEMISGLLYGSSLMLEQGSKLVGFTSMDGWAAQVQKSEAELVPAAEEVYDKYFNDETSPELKFLSIYAMTMFRHTAAQKAMSLLREIEALTEMDTLRTHRMQGLTDDDAIGAL